MYLAQSYMRPSHLPSQQVNPGEDWYQVIRMNQELASISISYNHVIRAVQNVTELALKSPMEKRT